MTQLRDFALMLIAAVLASVAWFAQVGVSIPPTQVMNPVSNWQVMIPANQTNNTTAFQDLSALSFTVVTGKKYEGRCVLRVNESVALDGFKTDFNGGTSTETVFFSGLNVTTGGTLALGTVIGSALNTSLVTSTLTGDAIFEIPFSLTVATGGTFFPRFGQSLHTLGTATVMQGSYCEIGETP